MRPKVGELNSSFRVALLFRLADEDGGFSQEQVMLGELMTRKGRQRWLRDMDEFGMIIMVVVNGMYK